MGEMKAVNNHKENNTKAEAVKQEKDFIFEKTYKCPICYQEFKSKTVKVGKARQIGTDIDLRPRFQNIDSLKYDVLMCSHCGYTALSKLFNQLSAREIRNIREKAEKSFDRKENEEWITYDAAIEYHRAALLTAIAKEAKESEKAYICLKTAWILRGKKEELQKDCEDKQAGILELEKKETQFLRLAMEGFLMAREKESPPFCGMDEVTLDYLLSYLCIRFDNFDIAIV